MTQLYKFIQSHRRSVGLTGSMIAFIVAIIYLIVVPDQVNATGGLVRVVLLYAHSICWFLLMFASFLWAIDRRPRVVAGLGYAALVCYLLFMGTLVIAVLS